jgi:hypothetical protein
MTGVNGKQYVQLAWLLAVLTAALLAVTAAWAKTIQTDVEDLKHEAATLQAQHEALGPRLQRIEDKIDRLYRAQIRP